MHRSPFIIDGFAYQSLESPRHDSWSRDGLPRSVVESGETLQNMAIQSGTVCICHTVHVRACATQKAARAQLYSEGQQSGT